MFQNEQELVLPDDQQKYVNALKIATFYCQQQRSLEDTQVKPVDYLSLYMHYKESGNTLSDLVFLRIVDYLKSFMDDNSNFEPKS